MAKNEKSTPRPGVSVPPAVTPTTPPPADTLPGVSAAPVGYDPKVSYTVAPGKSMTSFRGILSPGDKVTPEAFGPGIFETLLDAGRIVRA